MCGEASDVPASSATEDFRAHGGTADEGCDSPLGSPAPVDPCQLQNSCYGQHPAPAAPSATEAPAQAQAPSVKAAPPSPCASCDCVHVSAACPLLQPRCWVQDADGPTAAETLPPCLHIDGSMVRAGAAGLAAFTLLGPLRGRPVRPEQVTDATGLHHIWEVYGEGVFLDTIDPASSNWFRLLRPAPTRAERTVAVLTRGRCLFAVTTCDLAPDQELLYWQDDPGNTWQRKNMLKNSCGGCNLKFEHPLFYRRHCSLFHEPGTPLTIRKYYCKVCGEAVLGRQKLLRHALEQHGGAGAYQCQHCGKYFRRLGYLDVHRNHGCAANPLRTHPLCHLCGTRFCQPQKLRAHIRRVHSEAGSPPPEFRCQSCGRVLGCGTALRRHMREVHAAADGRHAQLHCRRCGKPFQNRSNLKIHMLTHSGVKPFHCALADCGATFTTKQCLQFHYRRQHQLTGSAMPPIRRAVPFTLTAYSGSLSEEPAATAAAAARRRLTRSDAIWEPAGAERPERPERLRFPGFSVSRDLPDQSNGPRLLRDASRTELDSIEPSVGLILDMSYRHRAEQT
ncbi:histone-lysine N-methyltransferase MECOM-like [Pollicipes pollicipes]|uniref:histone-lysine N-methyltransferase MECOM-like n=1 Tax=Pollicipes pollicipes TaxID=41117 RepID=UPI0018855297|nr:histone-lysine N-methyltransferase MECOM-like [Pollicipes pollicipes]